MKDISLVLRSLGLLESEIKTYLSALENGPGTVIDLTKQTKLSRQAVYVAIESLTERGLMSSALIGKKRFYSAEHPEKLLAYAKRRESEMTERVKDLERMVPELELQVGGERPIVRVFEGKEGLRVIVDDIKSTKARESVELADLDALYKVLTPEDLAGMRDQLRKINGKVRGLYAGVPQGQSVQADRLILPKQFSGFKSNISVYDDKVALVTFEGKMYSVIIESKTLARAVGILFELAFESKKISQ